MIDASANFDTYNALRAKRPVWVAEIYSVINFATGDYSGRTSTYYLYMKDFILEPVKIDPLTMHHDWGGYTFTVIDYNNSFTNTIKNYDLIGVKVTVKYGFYQLALTDFITLPLAYIDSWSLNNNLGEYVIRTKCLSTILKKPPIRSTTITYLAAGCTDSDTTIQLTDASSFNSYGFVMIGDEIIQYTSKSGNNIQGCTRGISSTTATAHSANDPVILVVNGSGQAGEFIMEALVNTNAGTNGFFDRGETGFGCGIAYTNLDENDVSNEDWKYSNFSGGSDCFQDFDYYYTKEDTDLLNILHKQVFEAAPCFLRYKNNLLTIQYMDYDYQDYYVDTADDDDFEINNFEVHRPLNLLLSKTKKDYGANDYTNEEKIQLDDSVADYGETEIFSVESAAAQNQKIGDLAVEAGDDLGQAIALRRFFWFGQEWFLLDITANMTKFLWEVGDVIKLSSDLLPNFTTGTRGITDKYFIILEKSFNNVLTFRMINFRDYLDKMGLCTINRVEYASITHPSSGYIEYDTDHADNNYQSTKDAIYDNPSSYQAAILRFDFECTSDGSGADNNAYAYFDLRVQKPINTDDKQRTVYCYFDSTRAYTFYPSYYIYHFNANGELSNDTWNRIRADWYYINTGDSTDLTVKLIRIVFIKLDISLSRIS